MLNALSYFIDPRGKIIPGVKVKIITKIITNILFFGKADPRNPLLLIRQQAYSKR